MAKPKAITQEPNMAKPKAITQEPNMAKPKAITQEPNGAALPTKIVLSCPFGYLDDSDVPHMWAANQEITEAAEIADLIAHGAEHTDLS